MHFMVYSQMQQQKKAALPTSALGSLDSQALRLTSVQYETFPPHVWSVAEGGDKRRSQIIHEEI